MSLISIIIPTLNEEENITKLLSKLKEIAPDAQVIVVDGGSTDNTVEKARYFTTVYTSQPGRGAQMNYGAKLAKGDILWFIHADCIPPDKSIEAINDVLKEPTMVGGAFEYCLNHPGILLRITETISNFKNRLLNLLYGDMGIFVRREVFEAIQGYKEIPLMEDMDFSRRLKRAGKIKIISMRMQTSARRWIEEGWLKCSIRSWLLQSAWALGASPAKLAKWYKFK